jgi:KaiC/GvpD/RAD55 family RecA-like ATPase
MGIIISQAGIGKTSVLVQLALDKLLQGKKVIHVSYTKHTHYVLGWYEDIFNEFISKKNLENAAEIKDEVVKNRVLMNFNQDGMSKDQIIRGLRSMIVEGGFPAEAIIVDGFDFFRADRERIANVKTFASELGLAIWYSCNVNESQKPGEENIPPAINDFADLFDVVIVLEPRQDHIEFSVTKDRNSHITKALAMRLDPKTMLILET